MSKRGYIGDRTDGCLWRIAATLTFLLLASGLVVAFYVVAMMITQGR